ncbi:MAG: zinc-ribbon domain-containing protein, partial [Desulfocapsaceae bacterium]
LCGHQLVVLSQCRECGKNLSAEARFCSRCGSATQEKAKAMICAECSKENMPGATFCNQCGSRLQDTDK